MIRNRFQQTVVTGRLTLPVVIALSTLTWIIAFIVKPTGIVSSTYVFWQIINNALSFNLLNIIISYLVYGATGYMLIELNNAFSLIRIRTSFQCSFYVLMLTACSFLFPLQAGSIANLSLLIGIYYLFLSYQKRGAAGLIFHSFLFVGLGSLLFPLLIFYVPLLLIGAYSFKSLTLKTFFAAIIGLSLPYWFLFGHAFFYGEMNLFYAPFIEMCSLRPIDYKNIELYQIISVGFTILLLLISSIHSLVSSYRDKIRTRLFLNFFILITLFTSIFCFLQPQYINSFFPILLAGSSLLIGHLFALTTSKISNIFFILTVVLLITLAFYNLWIR